MAMQAIKRSEPTLGQRLQARRRQLGISMKRLAQEVGVCEKTIHNWEKESCFPVDKLDLICRALHWTRSDLLGHTDSDTDKLLQDVRATCRIIHGITACLRQIPDFDQARALILERDGLRKHLAVILDLPPVDSDLAGDLKRHQAWHAHHNKDHKQVALERCIRKCEQWGQRIGYVFAPLPLGRSA
jgi:transcriptional regulator with XRE-family HTH domain